MEQTIQFTIKDLVNLGFWIALILLIVYVILLLRQVILAIKDARKLVDDRRKEIDDILIKTPGIMDNVEKITGVTAKGMNSAYDGASKLARKFKKDDVSANDKVDEIIVG